MIFPAASRFARRRPRSCPREGCPVGPPRVAPAELLLTGRNLSQLWASIDPERRLLRSPQKLGMWIAVAEERDAHEIVTNAAGRGRHDHARRRSITVVRGSATWVRPRRGYADAHDSKGGRRLAEERVRSGRCTVSCCPVGRIHVESGQYTFVWVDDI